MHDAIFKAWEEAIHTAFLLLRGERLTELRDGRRPRTFNDLGLHPVSVEIGRVLACESLFPELEHCRFNPQVLRKEAMADARRIFLEEIREQQGWW